MKNLLLLFLLLFCLSGCSGMTHWWRDGGVKIGAKMECLPTGRAYPSGGKIVIRCAFGDK